MNKQERYEQQFPNNAIGNICLFDKACDEDDNFESVCDCYHNPHKVWCTSNIIEMEEQNDRFFLDVI